MAVALQSAAERRVTAADEIRLGAPARYDQPGVQISGLPDEKSGAFRLPIRMVND